MPLITDNLIVGGEDQSPPTKAVEDNVLVKSMQQIREEIHQQQCEIEEEHPIESHYVIKQDGILERHFNTKSSYLTDMFSLDSDSK
jgi:hypothetical protein